MKKDIRINALDSEDASKCALRGIFPPPKHVSFYEAVYKSTWAFKGRDLSDYLSRRFPETSEMAICERAWGHFNTGCTVPEAIVIMDDKNEYGWIYVPKNQSP